MKISSAPFIQTNLKIHGNVIGKMPKDKLMEVISITRDIGAYEREQIRLANLKRKLYKELSDLKTSKEINKLNSMNYTFIETRMEEISVLLGYTYTYHSSLKKEYREAPSKFIKV